jgi:acetyl-CoA C-acetyltransferase
VNASSVYVIGYARTPFGKFGGALRTLSLPQLGALSMTSALERAGIEPTRVDELALGVNFPGGDRSLARQVALRANVPDDRVAYTVDRACCSSLTAINLASKSIRLGEAAIALAGGVENLSRVPYFIEAARFGQRLGDIVLTDQLVVSCPYSGMARAVQASNEAKVYAVSRELQDEWAQRSQEQYAKALATGFFDGEIVPVDVLDTDGEHVVLTSDEVPRPNSTLEALSRLQTVNGSETVTAGNAPDLSSGSTALVLGNSPLDDEPTIRIAGWAAAAGDPQRIASMPAVAAQLALKSVGITLGDVNIIEINEAFAAVPLVSTIVLANGDLAEAALLRERTNVNGGSIAIGHPTGATAARLVMTAASELLRRGGGTGLVTICGGIGEAEAVVITVDDAHASTSSGRTG